MEGIWCLFSRELPLTIDDHTISFPTEMTVSFRQNDKCSNMSFQSNSSRVKKSMEIKTSSKVSFTSFVRSSSSSSSSSIVVR